MGVFTSFWCGNIIISTMMNYNTYIHMHCHLIPTTIHINKCTAISSQLANNSYCNQCWYFCVTLWYLKSTPVLNTTLSWSKFNDNWCKYISQFSLVHVLSFKPSVPVTCAYSITAVGIFVLERNNKIKLSLYECRMKEKLLPHLFTCIYTSLASCIVYNFRRPRSRHS